VAKKLLTSWQKHFRVYAVDLLGFGFSDKPSAAPYSADLYVELISDFIREVSGGPSNVMQVRWALPMPFAWRMNIPN